MSEGNSEFQPPKPKTISRRNFLIRSAAGLAGTAVAIAAGYPKRYEISQAVGEEIDEIIQPENMGPPQILALSPRDSDIPKVAALPQLPESITPYAVEQSNDEAMIVMPAGQLRQHTAAPVAQGAYTEAGQAVITTAEGLAAGEQQYCTLFTLASDPAQALAVGYDGGVYSYDNTLQEWTLVTTGDAAAQTVTRAPKNWEGLSLKKQLLADSLGAGIVTLQNLGYRPFGAIHSTTRMPEMSSKPIPAEDIARTEQEAINTDRHYMITKDGAVCDIHHIIGAAEKTLLVYVQTLLKSMEHGSQENFVRIPHGIANHALDFYTYEVSPQDLRTKDPYDITLHIMQDMSIRMEGITQRLAIEALGQSINKVMGTGGMGPEDMFSNTLGTVYMIQAMKQEGFDKFFAADIPNLLKDTALTNIQDTIYHHDQKIRDMFKKVIQSVVNRFGLDTSDKTTINNIALGTSQYIPVQVGHRGASIPRIPLDGIDLDRSHYSFVPVEVPGYSHNLPRFVDKFK